MGLVMCAGILTAQGLSYKTLATCKKNYAEIFKFKNQDITKLSEFPPGVYLARSITQSLEKSNEKYFSYQFFLEDSKQSLDICYEGDPTSAVQTQAFIPTLIDQNTNQKLGHTYWSISAALDKITGAIQSKRSLIPNKDYKNALINQGYKIFSSQVNHDIYQIRIERDVASWKETIIITYDQF